ncbi:MAG TPA: site-specific DNA-methyltransferase [Feifaniaceae bacterium]|nr:site-specific DNA-methyltransferase [Feifaniaceae bacterium]
MRVHCTEELHGCGGPGRFVLSRAEDALAMLTAEYAGSVQVIYLDPPFGTGDTFHVKLTAGKRSISLPAYSDKMREADYLLWMRSVLTGARELLSDTGSIYLHIDYRMSAKLRLLMDEIFGAEHFMNEIIWCYKSGGRSTRYYPRKHDTILFYRKTANVYFNIQAVGRPRGPEQRNHMRRFIDEEGRICFTIRSAGKIYTYFEDTPVYPSDVWDDIEHLQQKDKERVGYATQKPEALLSRVILASSRPGDLVCDLFSGSGTTAAAASKLGRRFLTVDASPFALYLLRARQLQAASAISLLEGEHELEIDFPADETEARFAARAVTHRGKLQLSVEQAEFDGDYPLVYAAVGTAKDGCFRPVLTNCQPTLPIFFPLEGIHNPVVQFTDAAGHQAFFTADV